MEKMLPLPQSLEAEQALLGCLINCPSEFVEIEDLVFPDDFYYSKHKELFIALKELSKKDSAIDFVTILEELKTSNKLTAVGGVTYITELSNYICTSNIKSYIDILKDKSNRRALIKVARKTIQNAYSEDLEKVTEEIEDSVYKINNNCENTNFNEIGQVVEDTLKQIEINYQNGGKILGISTGYKDLDNTISGLQKGDFIIVAARPSMGKTAFALNIAQYASKGANVGIFSLEMTKEQLAQRMISARCLIEFEKIKTGNLTDKEFEKMATGINEISSRHIFIDDESTTLASIKAKAKWLKNRKGLDVIMIDYLQLIESTEKSASREQEVSKISRELKKLAKQLNITVIALSQLSRAPEQRSDHRPILSDLRESGSIEQDADIILMLYRDEYYNKETDDKNIADVIINKNRNGEVKTIKLGWLGQYQRFAELDYRQS